jgi:hypothetical protein
MINIPSYIKIEPGNQKLIGGIHIQTHRLDGELISILRKKKIRKVGEKEIIQII